MHIFEPEIGNKTQITRKMEGARGFLIQPKNINFYLKNIDFPQFGNKKRFDAFHSLIQKHGGKNKVLNDVSKPFGS